MWHWMILRYIRYIYGCVCVWVVLYVYIFTYWTLFSSVLLYFIQCISARHVCSLGENDGPLLETVAESPPLQRVKAVSEASEASESSSVNSQGWDDLGKCFYTLLYMCTPMIWSICYFFVVVYLQNWIFSSSCLSSITTSSSSYILIGMVINPSCS